MIGNPGPGDRIAWTTHLGAESEAAVVILDDDDAGAAVPDLRGLWTAGRGLSIRIQRQDTDSGRVSGWLDNGDERFDLSGTFRDGRLSLTVETPEGTGRLAGEVRRRGGRLTVTLAGRDQAGRQGELTFTLTQPAGG